MEIKNIVSFVKFYESLLQEMGDIQQFTAFPRQIKIPQNIITSEETKKVVVKEISATKENTTKNIIKIEKTHQNDAIKNITTIEDLTKAIQSQSICDIQQFANKTVFVDGNPKAKILIIGEAPGQEEDEQGIPFCGRSGQLLMNAFASIGLQREKNIFITNSVFWRPPGNRNPYDSELNACKPFLEKLIEITEPEVVVCVGSVATQNILSTEDAISLMRGKIFTSKITLNAKVFCVYHPSYLLRNPSKKYEMYKDLLTIKPHISHLL